MSASRCAGCDLPVEEVGDTCSLKCYAYMCSLIANDVPLDERLEDLYQQPWYPKYEEEIRKVAELHEDPFIHPIE